MNGKDIIKRELVKKVSPNYKKRFGLFFYSKKSIEKINEVQIEDGQDGISNKLEIKNDILESFVNKTSSFKRTRIVTILRDTEWAFAYWEIGGNEYNQVKDELNTNGFTIKNTVLRVKNSDATKSFDIDIDSFASSWYFMPNMPGEEIEVEFGIRGSDNSFRKIATSNKIVLPKKLNDHSAIEHGEILWSDPTTGIVEHEALTNEEVVIEALGGEKIIKTIAGSNEFLRSLKELLYSGALLSSEVFAKLVSSLVSSIVSSGLSSSFSSFGKHENFIDKTNIVTANGENDDFWLVAGTELILYGATEPDADLRVAGKKVPLKDDGTFYLRMPLPDKTIELPVEAYSSNGKHYRKIVPIVTKRTE